MINYGVPFYTTYQSLQDQEIVWRPGTAESGDYKSPQEYDNESHYWDTVNPSLITPRLSESPPTSELGYSPDRKPFDAPFATPEYYHAYTPLPVWTALENDQHGQERALPGGQLDLELTCSLYIDEESTHRRSCVHNEARRSPKLNVRERARNANGKFICEICQRPYARRERMETCYSNHYQEKPHRCSGKCGRSNCTMSYSSPDSLRRHERLPEQRQAMCTKCHCLTSKQNIARHQNRCQSQPRA